MSNKTWHWGMTTTHSCSWGFRRTLGVDQNMGLTRGLPVILPFVAAHFREHLLWCLWSFHNLWETNFSEKLVIWGYYKVTGPFIWLPLDLHSFEFWAHSSTRFNCSLDQWVQPKGLSMGPNVLNTTSPACLSTTSHSAFFAPSLLD